MPLGTLSGALVSSRIENSLSLCQINLDFTLQRVDAPKEYLPIGSALSAHRRINAENGTAHRTARKLGYLFKEKLPDTPELVRTYGSRVCEILKVPGINPVGTPADGCFRDFVGADCTSLWAAATSSIAAIGVHLLSCMLARAFGAKKAIALWYEIVKDRQLEVILEAEGNHNVSNETVVAAYQDYSREELANLDTSARAWLSRADQARGTQQTQFDLIAKNLSLPTGETGNTSPYPNVLTAWCKAMDCMEKHLNGISQQVSDGAVLYAISAWHLYPDLMYFGDTPKEIKFDDPLFKKRAIMTLGLQQVAASEESKGPHWSLALSHLRYYGDAIRVDSEEDGSRVSALELLVVVLGSVLESWRINYRDRLDAIRWVSGLWEYLEKTCPFESTCMSLEVHTSWLAGLATAANHILSTSGHKLERCKDLLSHGERWAGDFLMSNAHDDKAFVPYFGLCNPQIMKALEEPLDIDAAIEYLRGISREMRLKDTEAVISYCSHDLGYFEYCTAVPHRHRGDIESHGQHARWIRARRIIPKRNFCAHSCHGKARFEHREFDISLRMREIQDKNEQCFIIQRNDKGSSCWWNDLAPIYGPGYIPTYSCGQDSEDSVCRCLDPSLAHNHSSELASSRIQSFGVKVSPEFEPYEFTQGIRIGGVAIELYVGKYAISRLPRQKYHFRNQKPCANSDSKDGLKWLQTLSPCPNRIWDYIQCLGSIAPSEQLLMQEDGSVMPGIDWEYSHGQAARLIIHNLEISPPMGWLSSLEFVGVISEVYKSLKGATISLKAIEFPLPDAYWTSIPSTHEGLTTHRNGFNRGTGLLLDHMDRQRTFACIAMMQTGFSNLQLDDLDKVIAMSCENSIFVAGLLLSDPYEVPQGRDIRHIVGNIGFAGLNLLISPPGGLKVPFPKNEVRNLQRSVYDFKREDKFKGTSLHLRFTGQRFPTVMTDPEDIDQQIFYVQSVISLWDRGNHIADLNLLNIEESPPERTSIDCHCREQVLASDDSDIRTIESWYEVLVPPRRTAVIRAHHNWAARLAAVALLTEVEKGHLVSVLGPERLCWKCLENAFTDPELHFPEILVD